MIAPLPVNASHPNQTTAEHKRHVNLTAAQLAFLDQGIAFFSQPVLRELAIGSWGSDWREGHEEAPYKRKSNTSHVVAPHVR